ncbi:MAG: hypothetical protein AABX84_01940 [Nanoarchaeota archaeon]
MKFLKVISEKENPLFKRKEVYVEIESESVPKKEYAEKIISEKFSTPEEWIAIKKIDGRFGSRIFRITASLYHSKEIKEQTEPKSKKTVQAAAPPTQ